MLPRIQEFSLIKNLLSAASKSCLTPLVVAGTLSLSPVTALAQAPTAEQLNAIAFSLNGKSYTNRDLNRWAIDFRRELERLPEEKRRDALINIAINMLLLAEQSRKEKIDESAEYKQRLEQLENRALRDIYLRENVASKVTKELIEERYVQLLAEFEPKPEIWARHILVETEDEGKALIDELDNGADFIALAQAKSTGPSGPNGGDLGYFGAEQMVAPFQAAAEKLNPGQHSQEPVQTQFGWHVIKVEDKRESKAPLFADVQNDIRALIFDEILKEKMEALRADAKIDVNPAQ